MDGRSNVGVYGRMDRQNDRQINGSLLQFQKTIMPMRKQKSIPFEPRHEISNNVVCATSKGSDQPAHTRSLIRAFASRLNIL